LAAVEGRSGVGFGFVFGGISIFLYNHHIKN
jgi:hypothetical protein